MAGHLIRRLNQISTTVFHQQVKQAGFDLTPVQFATLRTLVAYPNIDQAQIAAMIAYDRATIGGVLDRLEKKGFISRTISKADKRARECRLTREGRKIVETLTPLVESFQLEILAGLSTEERKQFITLAQKVVHFDRSTAIINRQS